MAGDWVAVERLCVAHREARRAAGRLSDEEKEERLVLYLEGAVGEPGEVFRQFLDQPSLILLPYAAGVGGPDFGSWERTPVSASKILGEEPRLWSPGQMDLHPVLKSPTHPELVERGIARLESKSVRIDPAEFPIGCWVLFVVDCGQSPGVTPRENLLALHRPTAEVVTRPERGSQLIRRLTANDLFSFWDEARDSRFSERASVGFAYMMLSQAIGLASEAIQEWRKAFGPFTDDSFLRRYEGIPQWIDVLRLNLLMEEILPFSLRWPLDS
ncbi:hypothetical protein [Singulisphaera acidiphila]|nr:hypothetical protein [Singulisphaera acidiphila]